MNPRSRRDPGRPVTPRTGNGPVSQTYLPGSRTAPSKARATVRDALASWGLSALAAEAELLASELVANASEHAPRSPIRLTVWPHVEPDGRRGILCRVSDHSSAWPRPQPLETNSVRGRGLQIVAALATNSGVTADRDGKTAWFTLAAPWPERTPSTRHAEPEAEPGA